MASIENRSRFVVTVQNREDLTQTFAYNRDKQLKLYIATLKADGYKPKLVRTNDSFAIRVRDAGHLNQCLYAHTEHVHGRHPDRQRRHQLVAGDYPRHRRLGRAGAGHGPAGDPHPWHLFCHGDAGAVAVRVFFGVPVSVVRRRERPARRQRPRNPPVRSHARPA